MALAWYAMKRVEGRWGGVPILFEGEGVCSCESRKMMGVHVKMTNFTFRKNRLLEKKNRCTPPCKSKTGLDEYAKVLYCKRRNFRQYKFLRILCRALDAR